MPSIRVRNPRRHHTVLGHTQLHDEPAAIPLVAQPANEDATISDRTARSSSAPAANSSSPPALNAGMRRTQPTNSAESGGSIGSRPVGFEGVRASSPEALMDSGSRRNSVTHRSRLLSTSNTRRGGRRPSIIAAAIGGHVDGEDHHDTVVDHLAAIDDHVATVTDLTNAANSIIMPPLGGFFDRTPVVNLQRVTSGTDSTDLGLRRTRTPGEISLASDAHELDQHVAEVLSKRAKLRRQLMGLRDFLKTPLGVLTAIYFFLVVFWGAAIVLFLLKWINLHNANTQAIWVEISSQVVNGLFTVTGVGMIPWRVMDTVYIGKILHYKRMVRNRRRKRGLQPLADENDLPDPLMDCTYDDVLSESEEMDLKKRQTQFSKSQTWYHPHETETHHAFHIRTALIICILVDLNSLGQCILCGCMWGLDRHERPAWTTGTLIPFTFLCSIGAGVLIWRGGRQTRKTKEVEQRLRKALEDGQDDAHSPERRSVKDKDMSRVDFAATSKAQEADEEGFEAASPQR